MLIKVTFKNGVNEDLFRHCAVYLDNFHLFNIKRLANVESVTKKKERFLTGAVEGLVKKIEAIESVVFELIEVKNGQIVVRVRGENLVFHFSFYAWKYREYIEETKNGRL